MGSPLLTFYFVLLNFDFICYALLFLFSTHSHARSLFLFKLTLGCSNQIAKWQLARESTESKAKKERIEDEFVEVLRRWFYYC